eukprot:gene13519-biopygen2000
MGDGLMGVQPLGVAQGPPPTPGQAGWVMAWGSPKVARPRRFPENCAAGSQRARSGLAAGPQGPAANLARIRHVSGTYPARTRSSLQGNFGNPQGSACNLHASAGVWWASPRNRQGPHGGV